MKRRMSWVFLCFLAAAAAAQAEPFRPRFSRSVETGAVEQDEVIGVLLDGDCYQSTQSSFADLRVFDSRGREIPRVVEQLTTSRSEERRRPLPAKIVSLVETPENRVEIVLRLEEKDRSADGLTFVTPLANYEQHIHVFGSHDSNTWLPLADGARIFDYSRYMDISNRDVALASNDFPDLKIVVENVVDERDSAIAELTRTFRRGEPESLTEKKQVTRQTFRIDRIEAWRLERVEAQRVAAQVDYSTEKFHLEHGSTGNQTVVATQTRGEPLVGFRLQATDRNFSRRVTVLAPRQRGVKTDWHEIGRGVVTQVGFRDFQRSQLEVSFPQAREKQYRLTIENGDNPPLEITGVTGVGRVYRLLFLAVPGESYQVRYGDENAAQPRYDLPAVFSQLDAGFSVKEASLGKPVVRRTDDETIFSPLSLLNNKIFLASLLIVLVPLLGWGLYVAARRVDSIAKEP